MITVAPNIFKPRNDWNVKAYRCKRSEDTFEKRVFMIIKHEVGISPGTEIEYRGRSFVMARQIFFAIMVKYTSYTLEKIGIYLGKDHATVLHAVTSIKNQYDTNKRFREMYDRIECKVKNINSD